MKEAELIAKQQLSIERLQAKLTAYRTASELIMALCYCIGGPLNDNKKAYTAEQREDFSRIVRLLEDADYPNDEAMKS